MWRKNSWLLGTLLSLFVFSDLQAETIRQITVGTADDNNSGGGCTMREAISIANSGIAVPYLQCPVTTSGSGDPVVYRIDLPAYTYKLRGADDDDGNASGDLDIRAHVILTGQGAASTIISGDFLLDRVFDINPLSAGPYTVTIENLTIQEGGRTQYRGGGLRILGRNSTVSLINCELTDNSADRGGGIYNNGRLTLADTLVGSNDAYLGGGVYNDIYGTLTIDSSEVSGNEVWGSSSGRGHGGGIYNNQGEVTITNNSTVSANISRQDYGYGGGLYNYRGEVSVSGSYIQSNAIDSIGGYGGGMYNSIGATLTLNNTNVWSNDGQGDDCRGGGMANMGTLRIHGGYIWDNYARNGGGGLYNFSDGDLRIDQGTVISDNMAADTGNDDDGHGGGIYNDGGYLRIDDSTITENTVQNHGAGIYNNGVLTVERTTVSSNNCTDFTEGRGGGIYSAGSRLFLSASTLAGNVAIYGGGIFTDSLTTILNSTLSGNSAMRRGGGIYFDGNAAGLSYVTISDNHAAGAESATGGGIDNSMGANVTIRASIIAGNDSINEVDCNGTFNWEGRSISGAGTGCGLAGGGGIEIPPEQVYTVLLGPLADNGGLTRTHALLRNSLAIDAIAEGDCPGFAGADEDQRGEERPADGNRDGIIGCDIGAYETALPPFPWPMFLPAMTKKTLD